MPARVMPPGRTISRELEARGWTQKDLAEIMGRPEQAISQIVNGDKEITPQTAIELSKAFGVSAQFWSNLEANYRLWLAARDKEPESIERKARLYSVAPVAELKKNGWLPDTKDIDRLEQAYLELMEADSVDRAGEFKIAARRSIKREAVTNHLEIWVKRVEWIVRNYDVGKYSRKSLDDGVSEIINLSENALNLDNIPFMLMELGIKFALVPHLSGTYLDGAVFSMNGNPVIALTLRYDRIDSFWFTLMHEIAHLVSGHDGMYLDTIFDRKGLSGREEKSADSLAQNWLINPEEYEIFVQNNHPYFRAKAISGFAESIGRHPSIVLGRLQFDGLVSWKSFRKLHEKARPHLEAFYDKPIG